MHLSYPVIPRESSVHFSPSLQEALPFFSLLHRESSSKRVVLLSDKAVETSWKPLVISLLQQAGITVLSFSIVGGESCKSYAKKEQIESFLFAHHVSRDEPLMCLGGGSILDLGGFVASTYKRGIPLLYIPTTLLAMVDACLGGKTGINAHNIKNSLGTFYPADHIFIVTELLSSLPLNILQEGWPEICKYALIYDLDLFHLLEQNSDLWHRQDPFFLQTLIIRSIKIKKEIVLEDLYESGLRRILNFGHTIAHAIEGFFLEKSSPVYSHGEAVAIGLYIETYLSYLLGNLLSWEEVQKIHNLLTLYQWPKIRSHAPFSYADLLPFLQRDKKNTSKDQCRFVLLSGIGSCSPYGGDYCASPPLELVEEAISYFRARFF